MIRKILVVVVVVLALAFVCIGVASGDGFNCKTLMIEPGTYGYGDGYQVLYETHTFMFGGIEIDFGTASFFLWDGTPVTSFFVGESTSYYEEYGGFSFEVFNGKLYVEDHSSCRTQYDFGVVFTL